MIDIKIISPQNNLETVESETENTGLHREIPKERYIYTYISSENRQQVVSDLRLM